MPVQSLWPSPVRSDAKWFSPDVCVCGVYKIILVVHRSVCVGWQEFTCRCASQVAFVQTWTLLLDGSV